MLTCTRRLTFEAGHRVMGHENKCAHLHGHSYKVWLTAEATGLDSVGRVVDFSVLKELVGGWIDWQWDHGFLLHEKDAAALVAVKSFQTEHGEQKVYLLDGNPTAENLAWHLLKEVCPRLLIRADVKIVRVVVQETENCSAEASL